MKTQNGKAETETSKVTDQIKDIQRHIKKLKKAKETIDDLKIKSIEPASQAIASEILKAAEIGKKLAAKLFE